MPKRFFIIFALLFSILLFAAYFSPTSAICTPPATPADDVIECTDDSFDVEGKDGNDTINIQPGAVVTDTVAGDYINEITGTGNDTIVNNGTVGDGIYGDSTDADGTGNDTIVNNGVVAGDISGDSNYGDGSGNDTIVNNGSTDAIYGDSANGTGSGSDTITNNGSTTSINGDGGFGAGTGDDNITNNGGTGAIYGDDQSGIGTGNDSITNSGTVSGDIIAGGGADTVTIQGNNAVVGGTIDGGEGFDTLTFALSTSDPDQYDEWAAQIAAANPAGGTLTFNGHVYTWANFEELRALLTYLGAPRVNRIADPLAVFCSPESGIDIYVIISSTEGAFSLRVSEGQLRAALTNAATSGENVLIASTAEARVYALSSGEIQVNNGDNSFAFAFDYEQACSPFDEPPAVIQVTEEALPGFTIFNRPR